MLNDHPIHLRGRDNGQFTDGSVGGFANYPIDNMVKESQSYSLKHQQTYPQILEGKAIGGVAVSDLQQSK